MKKFIALVLIFSGLILGIFHALHRFDKIGPKPGLIRKLSFISRFKERRKEEVFIISGAILTVIGLGMLVGRKKKSE